MAIPRYLCNLCDEQHTRERDARQCCPPDIEIKWECDVCPKQYGDEADADDCCAPEEEEETDD